MKTTSLELSGSCKFECIEFEGGSFPPMVSLDYVEHSTDHYHSDSDTSIDITKEDAEKIIAFLRAAHSIEA